MSIYASLRFVLCTPTVSRLHGAVHWTIKHLVQSLGQAVRWRFSNLWAMMCLLCEVKTLVRFQISAKDWNATRKNIMSLAASMLSAWWTHLLSSPSTYMTWLVQNWTHLHRLAMVCWLMLHDASITFLSLWFSGKILEIDGHRLWETIHVYPQSVPRLAQ